MASAFSTRDGSSSAQLRTEAPYWFAYRNSVKQRWEGRRLLEIFVTEFRDRTREYYTWAIHTGLCTINGQSVTPDYIVQHNDYMVNTVHRHEPPVTAEPIRVIYEDKEEGQLVIVKPGSIPIHPAGRYMRHTLIEMLSRALAVPTIYTSNRLDRLTSGVMILSTTRAAAQKLSSDFSLGLVRKAYVARVRGRFPEEQVVCKEPLLAVDRQTGVNVVHPLGKACETIFQRLSYDAASDTSVLLCRPITGRTHQIRVHVQWLGHPIPNDPIYAHRIWEELPPTSFAAVRIDVDRNNRAPGEEGYEAHGSAEIERVVAVLKHEKDTREDWARWRDEVRFGKLVREHGWELPTVFGPNGESAAQQAGFDPEKAAEQEDMGEACETCMCPVQPDPSPEELYIYLHAIKYETDEWAFEDELPWWARPDWRSARREATSSTGAAAESSSSAAAGAGPAVVHVANVAQRREPGGKLRVATGDANLPTLVQARTAAHAAAGAQARRAVKLLDVPEALDGELAPLELDEAEAPAMLCEVFTGLEDVAQRDIEAQLRLFGVPKIRTRSALHCGHVLVPSGRGAALAMRAFAAGRLPGVRAAYMVMHEALMDAELLLRLAMEKVELGNSKRAARLQAQAAAKARRAAKHKGEAVEPEAPTVEEGQKEEPDARTEGEEQLLADIKRHWHASRPARDAVFAAWWRAARAPARTFRGSVDRSSYHLPTLTTLLLEREVGELAGQWLEATALDGAGGAWRVDLKQAQLDVTLKLVPALGTPSAAGVAAPTFSHKSANNAPGSLFYALALPPPTAPPHRPSDVPTSLSAGGTALARFRAYTLASVLPLPQPDEKAPRRLRILEPCVGRGSIAIELAAALQRRIGGSSGSTLAGADIYACDIEAAELARASQMLTLCQTPVSPSDAVRVHLSSAPVDSTDVTALRSFLGAEPLDALLADLPWGHRVGNRSNVARLYPRLVHAFCALLRPGGYALLMTAEQKTFLRVLREIEGQARKTNAPWYMAVEALHLVEPGKEAEELDDDEYAHEHAHALRRQGEAEAKRWLGLRPVEVGFGVYLFLLRKTAM